jgi:hypothetical protein
LSFNRASVDGARATGQYAIGLFDVSSSYTMDAQSNSFSVSPTSVIADGSHDPAARGSGVIQT